MSPLYEEDIANDALALSSVVSKWTLVRHQWLIDTMRCVLTGEAPLSTKELFQFNEVKLDWNNLPPQMNTTFQKVKNSLENIWRRTSKVSHPMSGLTIFEQLDKYQKYAHRFMVASKLANQKLLSELAMRDSLTGARTRLTLSSSLQHEFNRSLRYKVPCTIALLDHDKFKNINDQYGHSMGDQVLSKTAEIIQDNLRPNDKLFRYGGDEWLILMPSTTNKMASITMKRILKLCNAMHFEADRKKPLHIAFSYGLAETENVNDPEEWVINADKQLYANKASQPA